MTCMRSVLIVDDHAVVRRGLHDLLRGAEGIEVVGEAQDGAQAIEVAGRVRPDVVILDPAMPVMDGREALGPILPCPCHDLFVGAASNVL